MPFAVRMTGVTCLLSLLAVFVWLQMQWLPVGSTERKERGAGAGGEPITVIDPQ